MPIHLSTHSDSTGITLEGTHELRALAPAMQADSSIDVVQSEHRGSTDSDVLKGGKQTISRCVRSQPERCPCLESRGLLRRLGLSFFLFGLINNGELHPLLLLALQPNAEQCSTSSSSLPHSTWSRRPRQRASSPSATSSPPCSPSLAGHTSSVAVCGTPSGSSAVRLSASSACG